MVWLRDQKDWFYNSFTSSRQTRHYAINLDKLENIWQNTDS